MKVPGSFRAKPNGSWEWRYRKKSKSFRVRTLEQAEKEAMKILLFDPESRPKAPPEPPEELPKDTTPQEAYNLWVEEAAPRLSYRRPVESLLRFMRLKKLALKDLKGIHMQNWWQAEEKRRGVVGSTLDRELSDLSRFFKWCWSREFIDKDPVKECLERPKKVKTKKKVLTNNQRERVLKALDEAGERDLSLAFALAFWQGFRLDSIIKLRWENIDWDSHDRPVVVLEVGKTEATKQAYWLESRTVEILRKWKQDKGVIFRGAKRDRWGRRLPMTKSNLYAKRDRWNRDVSEDLRLPTTKTHGRAWHIGRHTFATLKLSKGLSYSVVAKMGGWENGKVLARAYEHLSLDDVKDGLD